MSGSSGPYPRDVVIYLSGLSGDRSAIHVEGVAQRLAVAFERNSATERASFTVEQGQSLPFGKGGASARMVSIKRVRDDGEIQALIDVFELEYQETLKGGYTQRTPIRQALSILGLLLASIPRFRRFVLKRSKTAGEKAQLGFAGVGLMLISLYFVVLIATALGTGAYALASTPLGPDSPNPAIEALGASLAWLQPAVVLLTGLGLFRREDIKSLISAFGVEYASAIDYLAFDMQKAVILGDFAALLEGVVESDVEYRDVHVLAYSFGSVVAMDALFQRREPPRRLARVRTLVTVGSPFDIIRSFWPEYYRDRLPRPAGGPWLNVFSPDDVLSSNFRDDGEAGDPVGEEGSGIPSFFRPNNIVFDWVKQGSRRPLGERLRRITQLHMMYWGGGVGAQTFLDDVVRVIWKEDVALG